MFLEPVLHYPRFSAMARKRIPLISRREMIGLLQAAPSEPKETDDAFVGNASEALLNLGKWLHLAGAD
jgi:hypothetical protein